MREHDWDGHGGCVDTCRACEIERLRAAFAELVVWLDNRRDAPDWTTLGMVKLKIHELSGAK